jgi:hypothetical protein
LCDNVEEYSRAGQAVVDSNNTAAHVLCMLDNEDYRHTHRICNTCCFSTTTVVTRTRSTVTVHVRFLPCTSELYCAKSLLDNVSVLFLKLNVLLTVHLSMSVQ